MIHMCSGNQSTVPPGTRLSTPPASGVPFEYLKKAIKSMIDNIMCFGIIQIIKFNVYFSNEKLNPLFQDHLHPLPCSAAACWPILAAAAATKADSLELVF